MRRPHRRGTPRTALEVRSQWTAWLRSTIGLRYDRVRRSPPLGGAFNLGNGGSAAAGQTSPKLGLVAGPFNLRRRHRVLRQLGPWLHSNDARGATARSNPGGRQRRWMPYPSSSRPGQRIGARAMPPCQPGAAASRCGAWTSLPNWSSSATKASPNLGRPAAEGIEWSNSFTGPGLDGGRRNHAVPGPLLSTPTRRRRPARPQRHSPPSVGEPRRRPGGPWFAGLRLRYLGAYPTWRKPASTNPPPSGWLTSRPATASRPKSRSASTSSTCSTRRPTTSNTGAAPAPAARILAGTGGCGSGTGIDGRLVHPLEPRSLRLALRAGF